MKPRLITSIMLFISAYSPLFLMLTVKDFNYECPFAGFNHPKTSWSLIILCAVSITLVFWIFSKMERGNKVVTVKAVRTRTLDTINYTIPYVFCVWDVDVSKTQDIIILAFFFLILLILTIRSQSVFINPLLAIAGYSFYDVDYEFDKKGYTTVVICKDEISEGDKFYFRLLTKFLYFAPQKLAPDEHK